MLKIDKVQTLDDITVYGDDANDHTFYLVPQTPRFRIENGKPVFKFVKYRELREENGDLFGGLCAFDTEFVVAPDKLTKVKAKLQAQVNARHHGHQPPAAVVAPLTYTEGTAQLNIGDQSGTLVQKVHGAGKPSLYGNNVATFWVELTKEGAAVFEAALQGEGGFVSVVYDLHIWARLPAIIGRAWWNASKFYSFFQQIDTDKHFWSEDSYQETVREKLISNEAMGTSLDFTAVPGLSADENNKMKAQIRDSMQQQLEKAVERNMLKEIQRTNPDTKSLRKDEGIEDIKRTVSMHEIASVNISYKESSTIEWPIVPQGLLPNITSMKGPDGKTYVWKDFAVDVDLNDPFFQTLEVSVNVNADFEDLPIFDVEVKLTYPFGDHPKVQEFTFKSPNDVGKFRTFVAGGKTSYKVVYQVNYKGSSHVFTSKEVTTDDTQLTINVDDLGILVVDIAAGDINFNQVEQAQLTVRYEDDGIAPIERQFTLTKDANTFKIREVILKTRDKPIKYDVKYFMADGREFAVTGQEQDAPQLYINDPFSANKTVELRGIGDMTNKISQIMVDLSYKDAGNNNYTQTTSVVLSKQQPFFSWTFPVIDENAGEVRYSGTVQYADGTIKDIPEQVATRPTIQVGDIVTDRLEVTVVPDLVDFTQVRLVDVKLHYTDQANGVAESKDLIFRSGDSSQTWTVDLKDKTARAYTWGATFFMADDAHSHKSLPNQPGDGDTIILEVPE